MQITVLAAQRHHWRADSCLLMIHRVATTLSDQNKKENHSSIEFGCSMNFLNFCSQSAPTAPSTTRWSHDSVTVMTLAVLGLPSVDGKTLALVSPTARMQDCGELMMAVKWDTPNIPKLETVMVPP